MSTEFSATIVFKDSEQKAYCLRVFVKIGNKVGAIDTAVWCDISWGKLCVMLIDIEKKARREIRVRRQRNLHLVRQ